jgi:NADP-dependent 3-hydroxy acid dehydrogenase YdfG
VLDVSQQGADVVKILSSEYRQASFSFHKTDIVNWGQLAQVFQQIYNEQGRIDIVFANAGISREDKFTLDEEWPSEPGLLTLAINLIGTIYSMSRISGFLLAFVSVAVKLAVHYLKKNDLVNGPKGASRGTIVCTASIATLYPFPIAPIYAATKRS